MVRYLAFDFEINVRRWIGGLLVVLYTRHFDSCRRLIVSASICSQLRHCYRHATPLYPTFYLEFLFYFFFHILFLKGINEDGHWPGDWVIVKDGSDALKYDRWSRVRVIICQYWATSLRGNFLVFWEGDVRPEKQRMYVSCLKTDKSENFCILVTLYFNSTWMD